jgi:hypothetical protein
MANYYDELLKLCGFEDEEINEEKPRIEKAFQKLELGPEDMNRAVPWVRENNHVELVGVRKLLRIWILELIDLVLAKDEGKKLVYSGFPTISPGPGWAIKATDPEGIYSASPDVILCRTLGQIFNKLNPILEAGEEHGLPPGHALCSLLQVRAGGMAKGIIPVPDLAFGSSYFCDMGSKADELFRETYGHRAVYIDGSMDSAWGEYPDFLPERVKFLGAQLDKATNIIKEVLGVEVTPESWQKVNDITGRFFHSLGQLVQLTLTDPLPISTVATGTALELYYGCTGRAMTDGPQAMDILVKEVKQRVDKGIGILEKGTPRVLIGINNLSDPRITHMFEEAGLAPIATGMAIRPDFVTRKARAPEGTYTTHGEIRAEQELIDGMWHSSYASLQRHIEEVMAWKPDGVIDVYLFSCRPAALESHNYKLAAEKTGIPHLPLEIDLYDTRNYSAEALRTKVETFADMLRARKAR